MNESLENKRERVAFGAAALLINEALCGDPKAAAALVELAARLCEAVDDLPLELTKEIAARRVSWPGLLGAHPAAVSDAEAKLRVLGLGRLHRYAKTFGIPTGPKRARLDSPAQAISIECHDAVMRLIRRAADKVKDGESLDADEAEAHALPPLNKDTLTLWFALGWRCWCAACTEEKDGGRVFKTDAARSLAEPLVISEPDRTALNKLERAVFRASSWWA